MRVITGKYKGRHFDVPRTFKARPTTDFAKENLFNVLGRYLDFEEEPVALDLFSGTGSITLELLSRGCRRVVSVEKDPLHYSFIRSFNTRICSFSSATSSFCFLFKLFDLLSDAIHLFFLFEFRNDNLRAVPHPKIAHPNLIK